ncbi:hypothetical protein VE02_09104 [Pseudogymnoascus sp. 03VT05]|nr:hypothetical protein VE02_09104 [Pseudogymnoascus sp. 03VT05]
MKSSTEDGVLFGNVASIKETTANAPNWVPILENPVYAPRKLRLVCIGAGYAGLMLAYHLRDAKMEEFIDLRIYEKNHDVGFGNILVDAKTFEIKALIDWEFCYAAPRQFLNAPPPWLIPNPDPWDWTAKERDVYKVHFMNFIKVLRDEESILGKGHSYSAQMQIYFENGIFWYFQAVREPLCCLELMQSWSAKVGQPLETPVDIDELVVKRFKTPALK